MLFKLTSLTREQKIFLLAVVLAGLGVIYYLLSGRQSLNENLRQLKKSDSRVERVSESTSSTGGRDITVTCRDGSSYQVYYPPGEGDYEVLADSKCQ